MPSQSLDNRSAEYRPARVNVYAGIRERIVWSQYPPGTRLVERDLANDFGVSRVPIRESLQALAAEGYVEMVPRRGAVVASLSPSAARELFEVRSVLDPFAMRLAVRNATTEQRDEMRQLLRDVVSALERADVNDLSELHHTFHETIVEMSGNQSLKESMKPIGMRTRLIVARTQLGDRQMLWNEHFDMADAIIRGDEGLGAQLAEVHVANASRSYLMTSDSAE